MGCATGSIKLVIFTLNFILVCIGFGMVLFGVMDSSTSSEYSDIKDLIQDISLLSKVLIVAGAVVFFVAFFGCWGTVTESTCMLLMYAIFLICLILLETAIVVYSYVHRDTVKQNAAKAFNEMIVEYNSSNATSKIVDKIQMKLKCCGAESYEDWTKKSFKLPLSCCEEKGITYCDQDKSYKTGCLVKGMEWLKDQLKKYTWIVAAVLGCEVLTIFFTLMVHNAIKNEDRRSGYA